jgi:hypothetical protein
MILIANLSRNLFFLLKQKTLAISDSCVIDLTVFNISTLIWLNLSEILIINAFLLFSHTSCEKGYSLWS